MPQTHLVVESGAGAIRIRWSKQEQRQVPEPSAWDRARDQREDLVTRRRLLQQVAADLATGLQPPSVLEEVLVHGDGVLPVEVLRGGETGFLFQDHHRWVVRCPQGIDATASSNGVHEEVLRVLVMAASPEDQHAIDYEDEEERVLKALDPMRQLGQVQVRVVEGGTREALRDGIEQFRPHVVSLLCHGKAADGDPAALCFEAVDGGTDLVTATDLKRLLAGAPVRLLVLTACHSGELESVAPAMLSAVPEVVGYASAVQQLSAIGMTEALFQALVEGAKVGEACARARHAMREHPDWALLVHYGKGPSKALVHAVPRDEWPAPQPMTRSGFVGRRRELRQVRQHAREGIFCHWVHGPGGIGKSTLARRAAREVPEAKVVERDEPLRAGMLLSHLVRYLDEHEDQATAQAIKAAHTARERVPGVSLPALTEQLAWEVGQLLPFVLILHDVEKMYAERLPEGDEVSLPEGLQADFEALARGLTKAQRSRCYVTCRYRPAELGEQIGILPLGALHGADRRKHLSRHPKVASHQALVVKVAGHPRAVEKLEEVLRVDLSPEEIAALLEAELGARFEDMLVAKLVDQLPAAEQHDLARVSALFGLSGMQETVAVLAWDEVHEKDKRLRYERFVEDLCGRALLMRPQLGGDLYEVDPVTREYLGRRFPEQAREGHRRAAEHFEAEVKRDRSLWTHLRARRHWLALADYKRAAEIGQAVFAALDGWGQPQRASDLADDMLVNTGGDQRLRANALHNVGIAHQSVGDLDAAQRRFEESLTIEREIGNRRGVASSMHQIGMVRQDRGEVDAALRHYEESLAIMREIGDRRGVAASLHHIGMVHELRGELDAALRRYEESLTIERELGNRQGVAASLHQIGIVHELRGELDAALRRYKESLVMKREIGDRRGLAATLGQIGMVHQRCGDLEAALRHYEESQSIRREMGDRQGMAINLHNIGIVHQLRHELDAALSYYEESLAIEREIGNRGGVAASLAQIGMVHLLRGDLDAALRHYGESLAIRREIREPHGVAISLHQIGRVLEESGRPRAAIAPIAQAFVILRQIGIADVKQARASLARLRHTLGEAEFAKAVEAAGFKYHGEAVAG